MSNEQNDTLPPIVDSDVRVPVDGYLSPGMSDDNPWATHLAKFSGGGFEIVDNIAARDAITPDRRPDKMVLVRSNEDGVTELFEYKVNTWQSVDLSSHVTPTKSGIEVDDGVSDVASITKINTKGMKITKTPNTDGNASGEIDLTAGINIHMMSPDNQAGNGLCNELIVEAPLSVYDDPNSANKFAARLTMDHRAFEHQHAAQCLVKMSKDVVVDGQKETVLYCDDEIVPTGEYFSFNQDAQGLNVQDNTGGDTAVTGGELTEILASVGFYGAAPENGNIKVYIWYKDPTSVLPAGILKDVNGIPMVVEKYFNKGDDLSPSSMPIVLSGAMMATGNAPIKLMVETSFSNGQFIAVNPNTTMININQFNDGYETTLSRITFERRVGVEIIPAIHKFDTKWFDIHQELAVDEPEVTVTAGQTSDVLNIAGMTVVSGSVKTSIKDGILYVKDTGSLSDVYIDSQVDNIRTQMLRGKEVTATIAANSVDAGWKWDCLVWTGKPDHQTQIYSSRNSGSINLNTGWVKLSDGFLAENISGGMSSVAINATIPANANNIAFVAYPVNAQSPLEIEVQGLTLGNATPFKGWLEVVRYNTHEQHFRFDEEYAEFLTNVQGYAGLRYTIGTANVDGYPMPVGHFVKGKAPVKHNTQLNKVGGSQDPENDGVIEFEKDGEANISVDYLVYNEGSDAVTLTFWDVLYPVGASEGQETKILDSLYTHPVTIPPNTTTPITVPVVAYNVEVETGQSIGHRVLADKAGCYVKTTSTREYLNQTTLSLRELVGANDDPDLVNLPYEKKTIVDRRILPFTNNTASTINFAIDIPSDVRLAAHSLVSKSGVQVISEDNTRFRYDNNSKILTISGVTGLSEGEIYLEFWG